MGNKIGKFDIDKRYIDIMCLGILLEFIIVEAIFTCLYKYGNNIPSFVNFLFENETLYSVFQITKEYVNEIIMVILPVVVTILSVSMSVSHEKIYGLTLAQFRKTNKNEKYTLTGMVIWSFVLVAFSVVLYCFDLFYSLVVLNIIALFYAIYFCVQEISLLARMDWRLNRMIDSIRSLYDDKIQESENNLTENDYLWIQDCKMIFGALCYTGTLENGYNKLARRQTNTLSCLNEITSFYGSYLKESCAENATNADILIKNVFHNLNFYFETVRKLECDDKQKFKSYPAVEIIETLISYLNKNDLYSEYENQIYQNIVLKIAPGYQTLKQGQNRFSYLMSISNHLMIVSSYNKEAWYFTLLARFFKEENNKPAEANEDYLFFVSIFMYYLFSSNCLGKKYATSVNNILKTTWSETISSMFNDLVQITGYISTPKLLNFLLMLFDNYEMTVSVNSLGIRRPKLEFNKEYIICWWINLVFADNRIQSDTDTKSIINDAKFGNNDELVKTTVKLFLDRYKSLDFDLIDKLPGYFKMFGFKVEQNKFKTNTLTTLSQYDSKENVSISFETIDADLENDKSHILETMKNVDNNSTWYKDSVNDESENSYVDKLYFHIYYSEIDRNAEIFTSDEYKEYVFDICLDTFNLLGEKVNDSRLNSFLCRDFIKRLIKAKIDGTNPVFRYNDILFDANALKINICYDFDECTIKKMGMFETINFIDEHFYFYNSYYRDNKSGKLYKTRDDLMDACGHTWFDFKLDCTVKMELDLESFMDFEKENVD